MGIDPGVANTGFGVVRVAGSQMVALDGGVVETPADAADRAAGWSGSTRALAELIAWHEPKAMALEEHLLRQERALGDRPSARPAASRCWPPPSAAIPCFDYTPQAIKMAVCGSGAAGKEQVQRMVGTLLGLPEPPDARPRRRRARGADLPRAAHRRSGDAAGRASRRGGGRPDDRRGPRRGPGAPARPRRHRRRRRRLPARRLRRDAEGGARRPASEAFLHAQLSPATTRSRSTASPPRRSATSSCELISVRGVGPKVAIATLSGGSPRELLRAIAAGDAKRFQAVPGIGKRTAERIIVELREKVAGELEEARPRRSPTDERRPAIAGPRRPASASATRRSRPSGCSTAAERRDARGADRRGAAQRRAPRRRHERHARPERIPLDEADDRADAEPRIARRAGRARRRGPRPLAAARRGSPTSSTRSR